MKKFIFFLISTILGYFTVLSITALAPEAGHIPTLVIFIYIFFSAVYYTILETLFC